MDESNDESSLWTSPKRPVYNDELHIERVHEYFITQLNDALKDFDSFSREFIQLLLLFAL